MAKLKYNPRGLIKSRDGTGMRICSHNNNFSILFPNDSITIRKAYSQVLSVLDGLGIDIVNIRRSRTKSVYISFLVPYYEYVCDIRISNHTMNGCPLREDPFIFASEYLSMVDIHTQKALNTFILNFGIIPHIANNYITHNTKKRIK